MLSNRQFLKSLLTKMSMRECLLSPGELMFKRCIWRKACTIFGETFEILKFSRLLVRRPILLQRKFAISEILSDKSEYERMFA